MALGPRHRLSVPAPPGRRKRDGTLLRSRFRTIQVSPKDLAATLQQVERAVDGRLRCQAEETRCPACGAVAVPRSRSQCNRCFPNIMPIGPPRPCVAPCAELAEA